MFRQKVCYTFTCMYACTICLTISHTKKKTTTLNKWTVWMCWAHKKYECVLVCDFVLFYRDFFLLHLRLFCFLFFYISIVFNVLNSKKKFVCWRMTVRLTVILFFCVCLPAVTVYGRISSMHTDTSSYMLLFVFLYFNSII